LKGKVEADRGREKNIKYTKVVCQCDKDLKGSSFFSHGVQGYTQKQGAVSFVFVIVLSKNKL
jgi:hypothetical protein